MLKLPGGRGFGVLLIASGSGLNPNVDLNNVFPEANCGKAGLALTSVAVA